MEREAKGEGVGDDVFSSVAAKTSGTSEPADFSSTATLVVWPCCQWRCCFPAGEAAVWFGAGRLHNKVTSC